MYSQGREEKARRGEEDLLLLCLVSPMTPPFDPRSGCGSVRVGGVVGYDLTVVIFPHESSR